MLEVVENKIRPDKGPFAVPANPATGTLAEHDAMLEDSLATRHGQLMGSGESGSGRANLGVNLAAAQLMSHWVQDVVSDVTPRYGRLDYSKNALDSHDVTSDLLQAGGPGNEDGLQPNDYDNSLHPIGALPSGYTLAQLQELVSQKQKKTKKKEEPAIGPHVSVRGVEAGSEAEIFLWYYVYTLGEHARWGTEADLLVDIGWPNEGVGTAPKGQVTVRIDRLGNVEAILLHSGNVSDPTIYKTRDEAMVGLQANYKFSAICDGDVQWTLVELNKVAAALGRLSPEEAGALAGVELMRVKANPEKKDEAGQYLWSMTPTDDQQVAQNRRLTITNLAFEADLVAFVGDKDDASAASRLTILHEVGHAIEQKNLDDARFAQAEANSAFNSASDACDLAYKEYVVKRNIAYAVIEGWKSTVQESANGFLGTISDAQQPLLALTGKHEKAQLEPLLKAAQLALAKRDHKKTELAQKSPKHPALITTTETIIAQDKWFAAAERMARLRIDLVDKDSALTAAGTEEPKQTFQSKRLNNFVTYVNKNEILPFTSYAKKTWSTNPGEFFAEAFALFKSDPTYMAANSKLLFDWFSAGEHLK